MDGYLRKTPQDIWEIALGELQIQVSKPNYRTWFSKTTGLSYKDNEFVIGVPNTFVAEYLEKNQRSLIEKSLISHTSPDVRVAFHVNSNKNARRNDPSSELPDREPATMKLNPRYVFESFIEGPSNRLARAAALSVTQNPGHSYNPLFISGGAGLGKTHLLHAIGQAAAANHFNVICCSAEQFTNEFVNAVRDRSTDVFRNKYRNIGMLLIDDIQFISGKEQTEESFFHTFNELHNTNRQIVITSDRLPKSMSLLEERLRSRLEWGLTVDIQPPDYPTRVAILQSKVRHLGNGVSEDVLELIAREDHRNIRTLEGNLNRVLAFSKLLRVAPSPDIARRALEDIASKEYMAPSISPTTILEAVADSFQMPTTELLGRKRDKDTTLARRLAMYLIRNETNCSLIQIGQILGNRDAAAVTSACKKVAIDITASPFLKRKIRDIRQHLLPETSINSAL